ncbi:Cdc123p [Sugiyamaella lignohabitans]|uniref:Cdc123p n=1 Tax=Sugiyamaella lignohabitans TaxID=796027 RepID=A0A167C6R5_9ASCO|nr:Cdc123p [Sugiyamaella lignohabitans]ANB11290.1 Cdc123p [Sugiyamaella lignohabitans]
MPSSTRTSVVDLTELDMGPRPSIKNVDNCAFSSWYPQYKKLCPKARLVKPLPKEFVEYLLADGIVLAKGDAGLVWEDTDGEVHGARIEEVDASVPLPENTSATTGNEAKEKEEVEEEEAEKEEEQENDGNEASEDEAEDPTIHFQELHNDIASLIKELGGSICPKLNWSAPKDALWISTTNNMKCINPSDIYMLLKASSYITHDLTEAYEGCVDFDESAPPKPEFELVLRKWFEINPALEFRCFVKDRNIVGITQRDMNYYEFLGPLKDKLEDEIHAFFEENLEFTFPDDSFVFDVYVPEPYDRVWLIDINPWASKTDTLLYSWEQLMGYDPLQTGFEPELRLVDKLDSSRGFGTVEHTESYVPKDFVDGGLNASSMSDMVDRLRQMMASQHDDSSDDE